MSIAYILINSESGKEEEVLKQLREIKGVLEAHMTYGIYDMVAKVEEKSKEELKNLIAFKIRHLEGVRSTLTMIVASRHD